jgi:hypothetical protein
VRGRRKDRRRVVFYFYMSITTQGKVERRIRGCNEKDHEDRASTFLLIWQGSSSQKENWAGAELESA